jgi:antitoxin component of RelBE/YafQ-DinJ toxin-antitoxin module
MPEIIHLTVKVDKKLKEHFSKLCKEEGIEVSQGVRELLAEAIARGYIIEQRKKQLQKISEEENVIVYRQGDKI